MDFFGDVKDIRKKKSALGMPPTYEDRTTVALVKFLVWHWTYGRKTQGTVRVFVSLLARTACTASVLKILADSIGGQGRHLKIKPAHHVRLEIQTRLLPTTECFLADLNVSDSQRNAEGQTKQSAKRETIHPSIGRGTVEGSQAASTSIDLIQVLPYNQLYPKHTSHRMSLRSIAHPPHSLILSKRETASQKRNSNHPNDNRCFIPTPAILPKTKTLTKEQEEEYDALLSSPMPSREKLVLSIELPSNMNDKDENQTVVAEQTPSNPEGTTAVEKDPTNEQVPTETKDEVTTDTDVPSETKAEVDSEAEATEKAIATADDETEAEAKPQAAVEEEESSDNIENDSKNESVPPQPHQKEGGDDKKDVEGDIHPIDQAEAEAVDEVEAKPDPPVDDELTPSPPPQQSAPCNKDSGFFLVFEDFVDLQTRLVLVPYIEEEGKGAIVASYPEDDRFEGLVLASMSKQQAQSVQRMDFTDILAGLRELSTPICLKFEAKEVEEDAMMAANHAGETEINEEKKEDDSSAKPEEITPGEDAKAETPKAGNHDNKDFEPKSSAHSTAEAQVEASTSTPKPTYQEKRQGTPSREHTRSLNSVLDDHRSTNNNTDNANAGHGSTLSSGMFALSAWGMRMKAQSEKLLATAGAKAAQPASPKKSSANESNSPQPPHCDMYIQTNLGTYFPISKASSKSDKPQHLQAVTTSSLYCIRKSATEHIPAGRDTVYKNNPVRYTFQWYRSSSKKKSSRDRFPISPSTLYRMENFDGESIGDSTLTSRRSRADSYSESVSSSGSSWSSSSSSSSSLCSSYSMSTDGVTHHTFSLASIGTNTTMSRTTKENNNKDATTTWIPLQGATGPSFQPNTTLVGKKLRCIVTISPVGGNSSDEEEGIRRQQPLSASAKSKESSASLSPQDSSNVSAIMDADDDDRNFQGDDFGISLLDEEDDRVERIICDLAIPIQADMILFNGAKQAMMVRGSANFGNLLGRKNSETATSACGKTFRVEVGTTRKTVLYTPPASSVASPHEYRPKPQRRSMNVNSVQIYCRSSPQDEYVQLTDIPLFQVTARVSSSNSRHVDLLFPAIPPLPSPPTDGDEDNKGVAEKSSTHRFLADYCIVDDSFCPEREIPRLELEAPNRMTRESFLLALGIANYRGKAALMDNKKVLYADDEPILQQMTKPKQEQPNQPPSSTTASSSKTSPKSSSQTDSSLSPQQEPQEPEACNSKKESDGDSVLALCGRKNDGQVFSGNLCLSPSRPSDVISDSKNVLSPISCCPSNQDNTPQSAESAAVSQSVSDAPAMPFILEANSKRVKELEREMKILRAQLSRKDKIVTELQRQVQVSDAAHQKTKHALSNTRQDLKQSQEDCERIQMSKRHVERSMQSQHEATQKLELDHRSVVSQLESQLSKQTEKITELEKANRSLQNEKAVLGATVEARESKLVKLEELQISNSELSKKVAEQGALEAQLEESHKKFERLQTELEGRKEAEIECRKELEAAKAKIQSIQKRIKGEQEKASSCQSQLEVIQKKNQQLKGERNSYKQKNESLSKEVARLCRGGKNIRDIEKVLADHESLLQETELLRIQKRKALEEAHKYRTSYEQAKAAEELLPLKPDERETRRMLERNAELERLLAEMTDYVSAKQMQLDTMKEVNEELQREIHSLAQANLRRDEV